jgi:hypothetical protein
MHEFSSISGTVHDDFGTPVSFVRVSAEEVDGPGFSFDSSDADGNFIVHVDPGDYRVSFGRTGYRNEYWEDVEFPADATVISVLVRDDVPIGTANITELPGVSGTVTDDGGTPRRGVGVVVCRSPCVGSIASATTNGSGHY